MEKLFGEFITTLVVFAFVVGFAIFKFKKAEKNIRQNEVDFGSNLKDFRDFFQSSGESFMEICKNLEQSQKIKLIDKDMSLDEFIQILGADKFMKNIGGQEKINEKNVSICARNLKNDLALGLYPLGDGKYYTFLYEKSQLFEIIDIASKLGENIIFCD